MSTNGLAGTGRMSKMSSPDYPFRYASMYFRTQADRDQFRWEQITRKAAKRLGWPHKTTTELEKFDAWRKGMHEARREKNERERKEKNARNQIRQEYGLGKSSTLFNFAAAMEKDKSIARLTPLVQTSLVAHWSADEKLAYIKRMIEERTPIQDFMMRTSQLVGAKL